LRSISPETPAFYSDRFIDAASYHFGSWLKEECNFEVVSTENLTRNEIEVAKISFQEALADKNKEKEPVVLENDARMLCYLNSDTVNSSEVYFLSWDKLFLEAAKEFYKPSADRRKRWIFNTPAKFIDLMNLLSFRVQP